MADTLRAIDEQKLKEFLTSLEKAGIKITKMESLTNWLSKKIEKGFTIEDISQKLKDYNYDFKEADRILEDQAAKKLESGDVAKRVEELESKIGGEEKKKKEQSQLNWIISSFMISVISAGTSYFISKQMVDIDTSVMGDAGGFLTAFIKGGWILGIVSGFVGLMLTAMFISEKYKHKTLIPDKEQKPI